MRLVPGVGSALPLFDVPEGDADTEIYIGRDFGCEVEIDDDRISNQHMRVFRECGVWHVENTSTVNRAFVTSGSKEEEQLTCGVPRKLVHGETLTLLVPPSRRLLDDKWYAYEIDLTPGEQNPPSRLYEEGAASSCAPSEKFDTKEWRSPFDTNPTFDTNDLKMLESMMGTEAAVDKLHRVSYGGLPDESEAEMLKGAFSPKKPTAEKKGPPRPSTRHLVLAAQRAVDESDGSWGSDSDDGA
mmetsp:Transcript_127319/g.220676  ORF Transcript_127319/g.220676 Transcript_127319/m.220676 type:complete len:242 (+) Transcript_127319:80-805(+)